MADALRMFLASDDLLSWTLALALSASVTAVVVFGFHRYGTGTLGVDVADEPRKRHHGAVPRVGGLGIFAAFLLVSWREEASAAWWFGGVALFALGFGDDLVRLNSLRKFLAQIAVALVCHALGLRWEGWPGGMWVSLPLTVFWIVGWTNAFNLIDGLNGLATGIAGLAFAAMADWSADTGLALGLSGAAAGFLGFNFPKARVFLGDGGAYLFGFAASALALGRSTPADPWAPAGLAVLLCVPWLDTLFAVVRRAGRGAPLLRGDAEHVHHRLRDRGFGEIGAVLVLLGVTAVSTVVAAWQGRVGNPWPGIAWVSVAGGVLMWMGRPTAAETSQKSNSARPSSSSNAGSDTASNSST